MKTKNELMKDFCYHISQSSFMRAGMIAGELKDKHNVTDEELERAKEGKVDAPDIFDIFGGFCK